MAKRHTILIFSFFSFFLINFAPAKSSIILNIILSAFVFVVLCFEKISSKTAYLFYNKKDKLLYIISSIVSALLAINFFIIWFPSSKFTEILGNNIIIKTIALLVITLILSAGCFLTINMVLDTLRNFANDYKYKPQTIPDKNKKLSVKAIIILLSASVVCITICSKSSPIYPFNDWVDINCFFTVGKSVANGRIMYKDIFEQKGPLLYFLYSVIYYISSDTFLGAYIVEIASFFSFLVITYKILLLICDEKIIYLIPLAAAFICSTPAMSHGGSAEELCIPIIILPYYFGIDAIIQKKELTPVKWFIIGVSSGMVLWIKFTMLGFYFGFGLFFLIHYLVNRKFSHLIKSLFSLIAGISFVSIPIFIYFIMNNAVSDLFTVYFYDNIFMYSVGNNSGIIVKIINNIFTGLKIFTNSFKIGVIVILLGFFGVYYINKKVFLLSVITFFFSFVFIYIGGREISYYSFIFSLFIPFGIAFIYMGLIPILKTLKNKSIKMNFPLSKKICILSGYIIIFVAMFMMSSNIYLLKYKQSDMPQYKFNKIISQSKNPTLLNYGFLDGGFYTVSGIVPNCRFFCGLNLPYEEIGNTQNYYVSNGLVDYIVTKDDIKPTNLKHYICADTQEFEFEGTVHTYNLYKKKNIP